MLLYGKMMYASLLVLGYMFMWAMISLAFSMVVVHGEEHEIGLWVRTLVSMKERVKRLDSSVLSFNPKNELKREKFV